MSLQEKAKDLFDSSKEPAFEIVYEIMDRRTYSDVLEGLNIEYEQYEAIREKILRLGLLTTKRDKNLDDLYENILNIQSFLEDASKNKKTSLKRFKRVDRKDFFEVSKFGKEFIDFFMNIEESN